MEVIEMSSTAEPGNFASGKEQFRNAVILDVRPETIQYMSPDQLAAVQSRLGYGGQYGKWITPHEWLPAGTMRDSVKEVDFRKRLHFLGVKQSLLDEAVLYCTRYTILLALTPSGMGSKARNRSLKPYTIVQILYQTLIPLVAEALARRNDGCLYFSCFDDERIFESRGKTSAKNLRIELNRAHMFCDLGLWPDRPGIGASTRGKDFTPEVSGPDIRAKGEQIAKKYKPLPDEWVAEAGWRVLWLVKDLGPNLLVLGRRLAQVVCDNPYENSSSPATIEKIRRREGRKILEAHRWVDRNGCEIGSPPFPLTICAARGAPRLNPGQWPPTHVPHILKLLRLLSYGHLFLALLAVGSRISEMLSLRTNSVARSIGGTPFIDGLTYKLTETIGGEERDWPLPSDVLMAICQQEASRKVICEIGRWSADPISDAEISDSLWVRYGSKNEMSVQSVSDDLRSLASSVGLQTDPDGQNLSTHRFRKTIARLVALALAGAPKILMDLFGHKTIEMTLYYILTDPDIAAEAKIISEEMIIMRAVTAIENIDEYGGKATRSIKCMVEQERFRLGRDLGADDIRGLAEILTMNGQSWELARPGVICTKLPGSFGECAKKVGHPEPSHCGSNCDHRLEEAFLRKDVDGAIADATILYEKERDAGNDLMQDFWAGQVLTHLNRFDDLREKWSIHPSVQDILKYEEKAI